MGKSISEISSVIRVSGLRKSFGKIRAVDGINFEVERGTVFALLGPNGAGKTTAISMLEGLLQRDSGNIEILGMDPWAEHGTVRMRIGVMPQGFNFFEKLTPLDSLVFYRDLFESSVDPESLLRLVILDDSRNVPFEKLSGGQKQKLGLALSLVNDPEILFLDEPTTGLDPSARRAIWSIIRMFRDRGKTIILTTHYMEEAEQLADNIAIISHGRIIAEGSPEGIVSRYGSGRKVVIKAGKEMGDFLSSERIEASVNGKYFEIRLDPETNLSSLIGLIEDSGISYSQLTVRADSLEDVFIRLVGEMSEGELK